MDDQGVLYSWPWEQPLPPATPHPRLAELGLQGERIRLLSAKTLRASVVTENGKTATWLDSSVSALGKVLEHSAATFPELAGELVIQLVTCELFTAACTDSGKLMWWWAISLADHLTNETTDNSFTFTGVFYHILKEDLSLINFKTKTDLQEVGVAYLGVARRYRRAPGYVSDHALFIVPVAEWYT